MVNKLNGTTQIWADGYSFREVTETLATALGVRMNDDQAAEPKADRADTAISSDQDLPNGSPTCR